MGYRTAGMNIASKLKTKRTARIGIALLVFGMLALITQAQFEPIDATVVRVIDGDAIRVRVQGKEYTVRLIGVDTPETVIPDQDRAALWGGGQRLHQDGARRAAGRASHGLHW